MKRMLSILLMLMLVPCAALAEEEDEPVTPMHDLTMAHGFRFGGALSYMQLWDANYLNFLKTHCNSITATNEMKAYSLLDQSKSRASSDGMPRMNFSAADKMVAWAQENGLGVRGHVLVWDAYMTPWFFHEQYDAGKPLVSREVMLQRLESYITQVITHFEEKFPGVVYCWDVVNEAVGEGSEFDSTDPRHIRTTRSGVSNVFYDTIGSDYVEYAFLYARNTVDGAWGGHPPVLQRLQHVLRRKTGCHYRPDTEHQQLRGGCGREPAQALRRRWDAGVHRRLRHAGGLHELE